jgi:hypothetical protein
LAHVIAEQLTQEYKGVWIVTWAPPRYEFVGGRRGRHGDRKVRESFFSAKHAELECTVYGWTVQDLKMRIQRFERRLRPAAVRDGYQVLAEVLDHALEQAQAGKGHARHGDDGVPLTEQPMFSISKALGAGHLAGQCAKKLAEAMRLESEARRRELLGAVVSIAGMVVHFDREEPTT